MQWYTGDWLKDPGVRSLTPAERGIWFDMINFMHESERRGYLMLNGRAMSEDRLASLLGLDKQILASALTSLLDLGVASREEETGAIYCRRMVRDEKLRKVRTEAGSKGGNPVLVKQIPTTPVKQKSTPSSSSSVSSSETTPPFPPAEPILDHVDVARRVGEECKITSTLAIREIQEQAKLELADGRTAEDVAAEMAASFQAYQQAKPNLQITWGLEKFFGEGHWRDPPSWPRKDGPKLVVQDAAYAKHNPQRSVIEEYEQWNSMSAMFKKENPWKGPVPA